MIKVDFQQRPIRNDKLISNSYTVVRVQWLPEMNKFTRCGGNGLRVPPVPIPNTEVKPQHADGTWLETARESRSLPHFIFLSSSMAEHSAVNRRVVGSSPTWGAT